MSRVIGMWRSSNGSTATFLSRHNILSPPGIVSVAGSLMVAASSVWQRLMATPFGVMFEILFALLMLWRRNGVNYAT